MPKVETVRRIITAQNAAGLGVLARDDRVEPIIAGGENANLGQQLWQIWGCDGIPQLPDDGEPGQYKETLFAPPGGYRVQVCEFPAASGTDLEPRGQWPELGTMLGRADTGVVSDEFGDINDRITHFTNSVDLMFVLDGDVIVELSDGDVTLGPGDVFVNLGAPHAWKLGSKPCRVCMVALGAERH